MNVGVMKDYKLRDLHASHTVEAHEDYKLKMRNLQIYTPRIEKLGTAYSCSERLFGTENFSPPKKQRRTTFQIPYSDRRARRP
jgi:hypothetical protein